jgi:hypothetical protein
MKTEHLINEMVSLCLEVPPELAQEIGSRDNDISFLSDILLGDEPCGSGKKYKKCCMKI